MDEMCHIIGTIQEMLITFLLTCSGTSEPIGSGERQDAWQPVQADASWSQ